MVHNYLLFVMQYQPPAQEVRQVMFVAVGDVNTCTAQLLTTEGERIRHPNRTTGC